MTILNVLKRNRLQIIHYSQLFRRNICTIAGKSLSLQRFFKSTTKKDSCDGELSKNYFSNLI